MPFTEAFRNALLDHAVGTTEYTFDTDLFVALFNGDPAGAGTEVEVTAVDGYNRQALSCAAAASGATSNDGAITFGPNTGAGSWTVTHFAIFDTQTPGAGTLKISGTITNRTVATNDSYQIAAGDLDITAT